MSDARDKRDQALADGDILQMLDAIFLLLEDQQDDHWFRWRASRGAV